MEFTIDSRFETFLLAYIPLLSLVSLVISLVALYLILTKTLRSSERYKWYLMNLQVWSTLLDTHFGISFVPIPLFPLISGYCRGVLYVLHFPMHYSLSILFFLGSEVAFAVMLALLFRDQSVISYASLFKMKTVFLSTVTIIYSIAQEWRISFLIVLQLLFLVPSFSFLSSKKQAKNDRRGFLELYPNMTWVTENPEFYDGDLMSIKFTVNSSGLVRLHVLSISLLALSIMQILHSLRAFFYISSFVQHSSVTFYGTFISMRDFENDHESRKVMSVKTLSFHNRLTLVVSLQAISISMTLILPILFHALSVITMAFPYEVCWIAYCVQLTFTIVHTSILISMIPSYVTTIFSWLNNNERKNRTTMCPREFHIANVKYINGVVTVY